MTYFQVLATFIGPPLLILLAVVPRDAWRWLVRRDVQVNWEPYLIVGVHVLIAVAYTTPWDNYLVATSVWWYDEALVTGITIGYVPIEEYTFFVVQTLMTGFWTLALMYHILPEKPDIQPSPALRRNATAAVFVLWVISTIVLILGWQPGTYMTLILSWALIPILIQFAFGADILLSRWRTVLPAIAIPTLYLWVVDYLAIASGTWTIDPAQTTGLKVGVLPIEEMLFFLVTNVLIGFGVTLMLTEKSKERARAMVGWVRKRLSEGRHAAAR